MSHRLRLTAFALVTVALLAGACSTQPEPERTPTVEWVVDRDPVTGAADLVVPTGLPPSAVNGVTHEQAARKFLESHKHLFKLRDPAAQLALVEVHRASEGDVAVTFGQREGDLRVEGAFVTVHFNRNEAIGMVTASVVPDASKGVVTPVVSARQAVAAAEQYVQAHIGGYDPARLKAPPAPVLVLVPRGATAVAAWRFTLSGSASRYYALRFHVDPMTGSVIKASDLHLPITAIGEGVRGDWKSFEVRDNPQPNLPRYEMYQTGIGGPGGRERITTSAYQAGTGDWQIIRSIDLTTWDPYVEKKGRGAAVDAHVHTAEVDRWFRDQLRYASWDGRGSPIENVVHYNAEDWGAWGGDGLLIFSDAGDLYYRDGNGDVQVMQAVSTAVARDVIAHEFMHSVTGEKLAYEGATGAMNEAMSDIFAGFMDHYRGGDAAALGEALGFALRRMDRPKDGLSSQPDHVSVARTLGPGEAPGPDNDDGYVHYNSGIVNNAWYLMTFGGTNDTSKMPVTKPLGADRSLRLWWRTVRRLIASTKDFDPLARMQIAEAQRMGLPVEPVACAWVAVGVVEHDWVKRRYQDVRCFCEDDKGAPISEAELACCEPGTSDACCRSCEEPAPPPSDDGGSGGGAPTEPELFDSCAGRADGVYCSQLAEFSAIVCSGESIQYGLQCPGTKCLGPNGPGALQCEGAPTPPPPTGEPGSDAPKGDTCMGRPDGIYCSVNPLSLYAAYICKDGSVAGGEICTTGNCVGPNGPGTQIQCQ